MAVGLGLPSAYAGDRKSAAAQQAQGALVHRVVFVSPAKFSGDDHAARNSMKLQGRGDLPFFPVSPFEARAAHASEKALGDDQQREKGPTTAPRERKGVTFFRFDSKVGAISVQPVVGGVNGAQLSLGF
jgi:hypothetical protein